MTTAIAPKATDDRVLAFVRRHQHGLWRWLRALGCQAEHAEEHCQDALLAALRDGIERYSARDAARWLRVASRNLFLMRLRAERRRPSWTSIDAIEADWQALRGDDDGGSAALYALERCLAGLSAREHDLVTRRYRDDGSREVMAKHLGLGEAGVKQALRRLRTRLRICVERRLAAESETTASRLT